MMQYEIFVEMSVSWPGISCGALGSLTYVTDSLSPEDGGEVDSFHWHFSRSAEVAKSVSTTEKYSMYF
jgi:hypothetical protein